MSDLSDPRTVYEKRSQVTILDLREPFEFRTGSIEGAANIPVGQLMTDDSTVPRNAPVVLVCSDGDRSEMAALMLQMRGLEAHNLSGGIAGWEEAGLPLHPSGEAAQAGPAIGFGGARPA